MTIVANCFVVTAERWRGGGVVTEMDSSGSSFGKKGGASKQDAVAEYRNKVVWAALGCRKETCASETETWKSCDNKRCPAKR